MNKDSVLKNITLVELNEGDFIYKLIPSSVLNSRYIASSKRLPSLANIEPFYIIRQI